MTNPTDKLNVVLIQIDSLCRHFLTAYGNDWVQAPNLHAFAQKGAVFNNHYTGSLPCMPARREIWAGNEEFWWRGWGPLEPWDVTLPWLAGQQGITTMLVTDHFHLFEWGSTNFPYDFDGYEFYRGQEYDNWRTDDPAEIPDWARVMLQRDDMNLKMQYLRNVQDFSDEAHFFGPQVMAGAADWLRRNHDKAQFFLHVDCFDVHEPFHIPEPYRSMYTDADYRRFNPWPTYGRTDSGPAELSAEEIEWVRAQFAGNLTMVDRWLGRVFDALEEKNLFDTTAVIVTTDHGHYLGDHGWMGKPLAPMYHTLCHTPLMVWHPGGVHNGGGRVDGFTQTVDVFATVCDLLGLEKPAGQNVHSRSFAPAIFDPAGATARDYAVYGYSNRMVGLTAGGADGEWSLLRDHDQQAAPAYNYTHQVEHVNGFGILTRKLWRNTDFSDLQAGRFIPGVDAPVWRAPLRRHPAVQQRSDPRPDLLFHNASDPAQENDLAAERPDKVAELATLLRDHAQRLNVPEEQITRLRL